MPIEPSPSTLSNRARALFATVRQEAAFAWRLSPAVAVAGLLAPWAGAALLAATRADGALTRELASDVSPLAWLGVAAWLLAAVVAAAAGRQLWLARRTAEAAGFAALTLLCCLGAGRSSGWGVALLGDRTPSGLMVLHRQQTLGNLAALLPAAFALVGCYGTASPWVARRWRRPLLRTLVVPPLFLSSSFLLLSVYETARLVGGGAALEELGRWTELCLAVALTMYARLAHQRVRRATTPVLPALGAA